MPNPEENSQRFSGEQAKTYFWVGLWLVPHARTLSSSLLGSLAKGFSRKNLRKLCKFRRLGGCFGCFLFFLLGGGEGGVRDTRRGGVVFIENPRMGVSQVGAGAKYLFSGPKCPRRLFTASGKSAAILGVPRKVSYKFLQRRLNDPFLNNPISELVKLMASCEGRPEWRAERRVPADLQDGYLFRWRRFRGRRCLDHAHAAAMCFIGRCAARVQLSRAKLRQNI